LICADQYIAIDDTTGLVLQAESPDSEVVGHARARPKHDRLAKGTNVITHAAVNDDTLATSQHIALDRAIDGDLAGDGHQIALDGAVNRNRVSGHIQIVIDHLAATDHDLVATACLCGASRHCCEQAQQQQQCAKYQKPAAPGFLPHVHDYLLQAATISGRRRISVPLKTAQIRRSSSYVSFCGRSSC
jgi:hypothetical protein